MTTGSYLKQVREQYETYPYPDRNPEDEKRRLLYTWQDNLAQINHYCHQGKNAFKGSLRVFVAGGGTGDAVIFLAEQLRNADAEVVYLDISRSSMEIAQKRAEMRRLDNITWIHGSLLEIPALNLGEFDYISCTGVLHHLQDPEDGLNKLRSVLAPGGVLGIMVYGRYGRTGIYQIQDLMRIVNRNAPGMQESLANTKAMLACLPPSHRWKETGGFPHDAPDAELYDFFLHSQDRAYTVPELYDWIQKKCKLNMQLSRVDFGRLPYTPECYIKDPALLQIIKALPLAEQQAVAELIAGNIDRHCFYATQSGGTAASLDELDNVPYFFLGFESIKGRELSEHMRQNPGQQLLIKDPRTTITLVLAPGEYSEQLLRYLDGERSLREIFRLARKDMPSGGAGVTDDQLLEDFRPIFDLFNLAEGMLLRHKSVSRFPGIAELQSSAIQSSPLSDQRKP